MIISAKTNGITDALVSINKMPTEINIVKLSIGLTYISRRYYYFFNEK